MTKKTTKKVAKKTAKKAVASATQADENAPTQEPPSPPSFDHSQPFGEVSEPYRHESGRTVQFAQNGWLYSPTKAPVAKGKLEITNDGTGEPLPPAS